MTGLREKVFLTEAKDKADNTTDRRQEELMGEREEQVGMQRQGGGRREEMGGWRWICQTSLAIFKMFACYTRALTIDSAIGNVFGLLS